MSRKRAFFITFFLTFLVMLASFGILYASLDVKPRETEKNQQGVPINRAGIDDSKSILICMGQEQTNFFFLVKLNALQNKISVMTISPRFQLKIAQRTLQESLDKAGMMQCVYDLKQEFDIPVDFYLQCDYSTMANIIADFSDFGIAELGENLPAGIQSLLLKGAQRLDPNSLMNIIKTADGLLDTQIGLGFLNETLYTLIKYNLQTLKTTTPEKIKQNYDFMNTSLNTISINKLVRIIEFLSESNITYDREIIIKEEENAPEKFERLFKE